MSEFTSLNVLDTSSSFDKEYSAFNEWDKVPPTVPMLEINSFSHYNDIFQSQDPLKQAYKFQFEPMKINQSNVHFVNLTMLMLFSPRWNLR
ncbi:hypothetical protein JCM9140_3941 [Halalkalibacter wakoensis JCM 9140]|uniref:Uncharacterized protein n=1 Tax=Halalkalibacter wakoensis JCM 9140 TaxID=1236970 RepID=W4Q6Z8_9BACI|nr:hypothetical protein [Halalkalibacter wakoensis]GAE27782.1 hypothetical protein JCM9140_3941 [Halalkalibacter wakoensis JCM 9140]